MQIRMERKTLNTHRCYLCGLLSVTSLPSPLPHKHIYPEKVERMARAITHTFPRFHSKCLQAIACTNLSDNATC